MTRGLAKGVVFVRCCAKHKEIYNSAQIGGNNLCRSPVPLYIKRQVLADRRWPLYAELREIEARETNMTSVEIADVIAQGDQNFLVVLLDREGKRRLPITIGQFEGSALSMFLREINLPRPVTAEFAVRILDALEAELVEVRVEKLEQSIFYAVAVIKSGDRVKELDARPSDAMCVAVLKGAPLFVTDGAWEQGGQECSDEDIAQMGQSLQGESPELIKHFMKIPAVYRAEPDDPGQGQQLRLEIAHQRLDEKRLAGLGPGDAVEVELGPTLLYVDGVPRCVGMTVDVEGSAGIKIMAMAEGKAAADDGKKRLAVELGRGWLVWESEKEAAGGVVQLPRRLDEPAEVYIDGELWATGTLHAAQEGHVLKIAELV